MASYLEAKTGLKPGEDITLACCPERLAEGNMIQDIESIPVVVGGFTPDNTKETADFWSNLGCPVIPVSGPEEAEMIKLADNLWIDLNIALFNELCLVCHGLNIDVLEVISGANSLPKGKGSVNILFPGPGVGGSCLVKDPSGGVRKWKFKNKAFFGERNPESRAEFRIFRGTLLQSSCRCRSFAYRRK